MAFSTAFMILSLSTSSYSSSDERAARCERPVYSGLRVFFVVLHDGAVSAGRREEGKKGRREEGKKGRREEGKKGRRKKKTWAKKTRQEHVIKRFLTEVICIWSPYVYIYLFPKINNVYYFSFIISLHPPPSVGELATAPIRRSGRLWTVLCWLLFLAFVHHLDWSQDCQDPVWSRLLYVSKQDRENTEIYQGLRNSVLFEDWKMIMKS